MQRLNRVEAVGLAAYQPLYSVVVSRSRVMCPVLRPEFVGRPDYGESGMIPDVFVTPAS
jgi:hypothetical protein